MNKREPFLIKLNSFSETPEQKLEKLNRELRVQSELLNELELRVTRLEKQSQESKQ